MHSTREKVEMKKKKKKKPLLAVLNNLNLDRKKNS